MSEITATYILQSALDALSQRAAIRDQPSERNMNKNANSYQIGGEHYKTMDIQPWDVMEAVLTRQEFIGFLKGNIIKYSMRCGRKLDADDDAQKARHYVEKLNEFLRDV
jgi:hypothetical protein